MRERCQRAYGRSGILFHDPLSGYSTHNRGGYHSDRLEELEAQMSRTFDTEERAKLATEMTQTILDDNGFIFASHLKMSIVSGEGVSGLKRIPVIIMRSRWIWTRNRGQAGRENEQ